MIPAPAHTQLQEAEPWFLLRLEWMGRRYHFARAPMTLASSEGTIRFAGGLVLPDIEQGDERLSVSVEGASIPIQVQFERTDIAEEVRAGRHPILMTGQLMMVLKNRLTGAIGQSWEEAWPVQFGRVTGPQWGHPRRPSGWLVFSLEETPYDDDSPVLSAGWRITTDTWPDAPESSWNKPYPLVIGASPGVYTKPDLTTGHHYLTPAYRLNGNTGVGAELLASVGHTEAATKDAGSVGVQDADGNTQNLSISVKIDKQGQPCSVVDLGAATLISRNSSSYRICWSNGGGILNPFSRARAPLHRAVDVLRYLWSRTGLPIDHGAWQSLSGPLSPFGFGGFCNDPTQGAWALMRDDLLPFLPVSAYRGRFGIAPLLELPHLPAAQLPHITEGPGFRQVTPETPLRELRDVANELTLEFAVSHDGTALDVQRLGPQRIRDSGGIPDPICQASASRYNIGPQLRSRPADVSGWLWSRQDALPVLRWMAAEFGGIPTSTVYQARPAYGWIAKGQQLALSNPRLHLSRRRVQVIQRTWLHARGLWEFELQTADDTLLNS